MRSSIATKGDNLIVPLDNKEEYSNSGQLIDLFELIKSLSRYWKSITLITILGAMLSVVLALNIPKVYRTHLTFSLPSISSVVAINNKGINPYTQKTLFKAYYDKLRSKTFLREFILQHSYLERLYPKKYLNKKTDILNDGLFSNFVKSFKVVILEPTVKKNVFNNEPISISISFEHSNETVIVALINHYAAFANDTLFMEIQEQQIEQRAEMIAELNRKIKLLKDNALTRRNLLIDKIIINNNEKLESLKLKKSIAIAQAAADRGTRIAIQEEANVRRLNELKQQRELLIKQEEEDRKAEIAIAQEARSIAKSLDIIHPTQLDGVSKQSGFTNAEKTQINLSAEQKLPLYLMGTQYIDAYIETLKARKDRIVFLKEINKIETEMSKVKDDQTLKMLKLRKDDSPYLELINEIDAAIREVKNDQKLKALQTRKSDEPFIIELPKVLNKIDELELRVLSFRNLKASTQRDDALITNKSIRPNRPLIAIVGALFSGFLALLYGFVAVAMAKRRV